MSVHASITLPRALELKVGTLPRLVNVLTTQSSRLTASLSTGASCLLTGSDSLIGDQQVALFRAIQKGDLKAGAGHRFVPLQCLSHNVVHFNSEYDGLAREYAESGEYAGWHRSRTIHLSGQGTATHRRREVHTLHQPGDQ